MADTIGRISVPVPTASGVTFPLTSDYPFGMTRDWQIIEHRFGALATLAVQRFGVGSGARRFTFIKPALSISDHNSLLAFYNLVQGGFQSFTYNVPNTDRTTTTAYSVVFDSKPISVEDLVNSCRIGLNFTEIVDPSAAPSYSVLATYTRYPAGALATALLDQPQELVPLIHIKVRDSAVPDIYLSDRRVTVGGQLYLPRVTGIGDPGSDTLFTQDIRGSSDSVRFTFGNADRVMSALANDTGLKFASIDFSVYHIQQQAVLQLWKGIILSWNIDGSPSFTVQCSDGLYPITQAYPRRVVSRPCWKQFNTEIIPGSGIKPCPWDTASVPLHAGDPTKCDYFFNSPNGCLAHGMSPYFGGHPLIPQSVSIKDNGTGIIFGFGRDRVTSTSILSDSIMGRPLPEIWCNGHSDPLKAMVVNCLVVAVRDESDFEDVFGIVGAGPLGGFTGMTVAVNADGQRVLVSPLADGFTPSGFSVDSQLNITGYHPELGVRMVTGTDPVDTSHDAYSISQGSPARFDIPDPTYSNILTGQPNDIIPFAAGTALLEIRYQKSSGHGIAPTTAESHTMTVPLDQGLAGLYFDQFDNRLAQNGMTNPFWVAVNTYFRALSIEFGNPTQQLALFDRASVFRGDGTGCAEIADLVVPAIVGTGTETQFQFQGCLTEFKPFRDWLTEILSCCLGYYTFDFGKLRLGIRENASATKSYSLGNMLYQSFSITPAESAFEYLKIFFANQALQFQQDFGEYSDKDHAAYFGRQSAPLSSTIRSVGLCTLSQTLRVAATRVREEIGGILRPDLGTAQQYVEWDNNNICTFKSTILALDTGVGDVIEVTHPDCPTYPGPVGGSALPAHTWKFRVQSITLHRDWSVTIRAKSVTDSMYDLTVGPKPADINPTQPPAIFYNLPTNPMWAPYQDQATSTDALFANEWLFDVSCAPPTSQPLLANGLPNYALTVTGKFPVNSTAPNVGAPTIATITQSATGGSLPGNTTYRISICAVDSNGRLSAPSSVSIVQIPAGTNTNTITLSGIVWPLTTGLTGYQVFASDRDDLVCFQVSGSLTPGTGTSYTPTSITLTAAFARSTYALPNPNTNRIRIKGKRYIHSGIIGVKVGSVGVNTIVCPDLIDGSGTPIDLTGRIVSVLGRRNATVPFNSFTVTAWDHTTGTFTVTPDPSGIVLADDALSVRYLGYDNTSNQLQFQDTGIKNQTNGYSGMIANAEIGHVFRVIRGLNRGQTRRITGNTADTLSWDTPLLLDATSVGIVEDNPWIFTADSSSVLTSAPTSAISITIPVSNFLDQALLLVGFTVDNNEVESPDTDSPVREVWSYGAQGTKRISADATQVVTDGIVQFDTSAPTHAASTDTLSAAITDTTSTSISLTSGAAAVTGTYITIDSETMLLTSGGGSSWSVMRGQLGTTAATHSNGATVHIPGHIVYTLLPIASVPNLSLYLHKNTADINYVLVAEDAGDGGDTMILADTSASLGTVHLKAPGAS